MGDPTGTEPGPKAIEGKKGNGLESGKEVALAATAGISSGR